MLKIGDRVVTLMEITYAYSGWDDRDEVLAPAWSVGTVVLIEDSEDAIFIDFDHQPDKGHWVNTRGIHLQAIPQVWNVDKYHYISRGENEFIMYEIEMIDMGMGQRKFTLFVNRDDNWMNQDQESAWDTIDCTDTAYPLTDDIKTLQPIFEQLWVAFFKGVPCAKFTQGGGA